MIDLKNILVPTDFSDNSLNALEFSSCMAKQHNSLIHLLHVVEPDYLEQTPRAYDSMAHYRRARIMDAEEDVRRFLAKISLRDISVTESILEGYAPERIVNYAWDKKIDLILISAHGKGKNYLKPLGSVSQRVLKNSFVPVFLFKDSQPVHMNQRLKSDTHYIENWMS